MKIYRSQLESKAATMPAEYLADVRAAISKEDGAFVYMAREDYERIRAKWSASRGLGDTVKKVIDAVTFNAIPSCRKCRQRQAALNQAFPYK